MCDVLDLRWPYYTGAPFERSVGKIIMQLWGQSVFTGNFENENDERSVRV